MDVPPQTRLNQPHLKRIDWVQLFFSGYGRSGRLEFLATGAVILAFFVIYETIHGLPRLLTGWAALPLLLASGACVLSRRLHDRGRAGWWAALILAAFAVAWPKPQGPVDAVCVIVLAIALIDLGLLPGQRDFNRFGPVP
jgi:uncharacterized membrane protein YhaH (DUF805 family)